MRKLGMNPARLKAFILDLGDGPDLEQAHPFSTASGSLSFSSRSRPASALDVRETIRVTEDYKPLDIESATMAMALCRGIRERYPEWRYLIDGDGGDENLKDYPIEENPELTIRSVINNQMLYQEGWGVGQDQALAHLQRRPEPLLHAHLCARASLRLQGLQPLHPAQRDRRRRGHPFHRPDEIRRQLACMS